MVVWVLIHQGTLCFLHSTQILGDLLFFSTSLVFHLQFSYTSDNYFQCVATKYCVVTLQHSLSLFYALWLHGIWYKNWQGGDALLYHCYNRQEKLSKVAPGNILPNTCTYFQLIMSWSKFGKHWISMWISINEGHKVGFMGFVAPYSLFVVLLLASVFSPTTSILQSCLVGSNLVFAALRSPLSSCCCFTDNEEDRQQTYFPKWRRFTMKVFQVKESITQAEKMVKYQVYPQINQ